MSRTYNQISTPGRRGRVGVRKSKRIASKKVRKIMFLTDQRIEKIVRKSIAIDKDSPIKDHKKIVRH